MAIAQKVRIVTKGPKTSSEVMKELAERYDVDANYFDDAFSADVELVIVTTAGWIEERPSAKRRYRASVPGGYENAHELDEALEIQRAELEA